MWYLEDRLSCWDVWNQKYLGLSTDLFKKIYQEDRKHRTYQKSNKCWPSTMTGLRKEFAERKTET